LIAKSSAARSAPVCPPDMIFLTIPPGLILCLDLFEFGKKFLLGEKAFFDKELHGIIEFNGIGHEELFEAGQLVWVELGGHGRSPGEGGNKKTIAKKVSIFKWF
jgi:hypothetical protein